MRRLLLLLILLAAVPARAQPLVPVIVELAAPRGQGARIAAAQADLARDLAGTSFAVRRAYRGLPFVALRVGPDALARLARSPFVVGIEEDRLLRPVLDVSVPLVEADQMAAQLGLDGSGQVVAVLDTGVDVAHPNLAGKLVAEACFALGEPIGSGDCPNGNATDFGIGSGGYCTFSDECFHGTHVAGIAVGSGASYPGVAPGADLISIQVFSELSGASCPDGVGPCAGAWTSDQVAALEYVHDVLRPLHAIAAVNLSLGGATYASPSLCDFANAATKAAVDVLRADAIAVVAAAGNDGLAGQLAEPACISSVVSVSAVNDVDNAPGFANTASFLSLFAPGVQIRAPRWQSVGFQNASGTSMAAPHVAGAWALLRQGAPAASVDATLAALRGTGVAIADPEADTVRIRIRAAADVLFSACGDGVDNDGDGLVDHPADPGCVAPQGAKEDPACSDGIDNDGDALIDLADPQCSQRPWQDSENAVACGLGAELALALGLVAALRRRR